MVSLLMDVFLPKRKAKVMTNPRNAKEAINPTILLFMSSIMMIWAKKSKGKYVANIKKTV